MRERPCKTHAWATQWPPSPLGPLVLWSPGPWLPGAWSPGPLVFCPLVSGCFSQLVAYWIIGRAVWFCCTLDTSTNQPPPTIFQNHNGGAQSRGNNPIATNALPQPPSSFFNFCCNTLTWVSMVAVHNTCKNLDAPLALVADILVFFFGCLHFAASTIQNESTMLQIPCPVKFPTVATTIQHDNKKGLSSKMLQIPYNIRVFVFKLQNVAYTLQN